MSDVETRTRIATTSAVERAPSCRVFAAAFCLFVLLATTRVFVQYPPTLTYMPRGDRSEGLAADPKSADAIVLISALADLKQRVTYDEWPSALRMRFYLPKEEPKPRVNVRQIRSPKGYYVLDNVAPPSPPGAWVPAAVNEFRWPPSDVMAKIYDFQYPASSGALVSKGDWIAGLGVVVGLGDTGAATGSQNVAVAPAALYHSNQPLNVSGYRFTFRTNAPAVVTGGILSVANKAVLPGLRYDAIAGSPFTVFWPISAEPEGWYKLVLNVSFAGRPQVVVRFYHKDSLAK